MKNLFYIITLVYCLTTISIKAQTNTNKSTNVKTEPTKPLVVCCPDDKKTNEKKEQSSKPKEGTDKSKEHTDNSLDYKNYKTMMAK
jgi:hypothetical protein